MIKSHKIAEEFKKYFENINDLGLYEITSCPIKRLLIKYILKFQNLNLIPAF